MTWWENGACRGDHHPDDWFPDTPGSRNPNAVRAIQICRGCPVQTDCLNHAQNTPEIHGIWGGTTSQQRLGMRRRFTVPHGTNEGYQTHFRYGEQACPECREAHRIYQAAKRRIRQRAAQRDEAI
jgi:WhiB family redox-sensing transcriptional regulator